MLGSNNGLGQMSVKLNLSPDESEVLSKDDRANQGLKCYPVPDETAFSLKDHICSSESFLQMEAQVSVRLRSSAAPLPGKAKSGHSYLCSDYIPFRILCRGQPLKKTTVG